MRRHRKHTHAVQHQQLCWIVWILAVACVHSQVLSDTRAQSADGVTPTTPYGCPKSRFFDNPWVKSNTALTYALETKDGLGSQTTRMMAVYAIAHALDIPYVHTPFDCIGHIGALPHYRNASCSKISAADQRNLQRIKRQIWLPNTKAGLDTSQWQRHHVARGSWETLAAVAAAATHHKTPTLIQIELVDRFISHCPGLFYHVPAWRPADLSQVPVKAPATSPVLLGGGRSLRIVVHMRRGDLATRTAAKSNYSRELPTSYFISVTKNVMMELSALNHETSVEWFTEPPNTSEEYNDLEQIRQEIPNLTLLTDSDILWTWQQMWTADVFIMSKSFYSFVPAVINTKGINIHAPSMHSKCRIACAPVHWLGADESGKLSPELLAAIRTRFGPAGSASEAHSEE